MCDKSQQTHMFLAIRLLGLFLITNISNAFAGNAALSWDANTEADLAGYNVYYGTVSGSYGTPTDVGNQITHTITGLADGTYYFAVTAYDTSGNESGFSTEASKTISASDTTPPVISAISGNSTVDGATITWTTDEVSDTRIEYGLSASYGLSTSLNTAMVTSHSAAVGSLASETVYHYRVLSSDSSGNPASSGDNVFTTAPAADTTAPSISGLSSSSVTTAGASISWATNEPADTRVEYGTTTSYGSITTLQSSLVTSHSQNLTGLLSSTSYHFRVLSQDAANNLATSGDNTFITQTPPDTTPPVVSGITTSNITETTASISWATDEGASSQVEYGTTTDYGSFSNINSSFVTSHSRTLSGLANGTSYHYRVISSDSSLNVVNSGDNTFTTSAIPDTIGPVISNINAGSISSSGATIIWTTDEGASSQVEYGNTSSYGSISSLNTTLLTNHSRFLSGLSPSTTIHYRVISRDAANNITMSPDKTLLTATAPDTSGPVISNTGIESIGLTSATITWRTDEPATSQIDFGLTDAYGARSTKNETLLLSHKQTLLGLSQNTTYHFRIKGVDSIGNASTSDNQIFLTGTEVFQDTIPPEDIKRFSASEGERQITLSWENPPDLDFVGVRIRYRTDHFPENINDGELFGDISGQPNAVMKVMHNGLVEGTTYYYMAASYDNSGNFQTTVFVSGKTTTSGKGDASSGVGGCGIIRPSGEGEPPQPGDAAAMLAMIGIMVVALFRKGVNTCHWRIGDHS